MMFATCAERAIPQSANAPDMVHLLPLGDIKGRDGRFFRLVDAARVALNSLSQGMDLVIDYEHQGDTNPETQTGPIPAAGWIKELVARDDGLWGRVEWTARASELIAKKEYRYLSPVFQHLADGTVTRLRGAGLVHRPNLELTALASQQDTQEDTMTEATTLSQIAASLGLDDNTDGQAILDAIARLVSQPDPSKFVPIAALKEAIQGKLNAVSTNSEREAETKVSEAMSNGYLSPAMRGWALALCKQSPASFDGFIASAIPQFEHFFQPSQLGSRPPQQSRVADNSSEALAICAQLGLKPEDLKD
jgi:phage I-like protein